MSKVFSGQLFPLLLYYGGGEKNEDDDINHGCFDDGHDDAEDLEQFAADDEHSTLADDIVVVTGFVILIEP